MHVSSDCTRDTSAGVMVWGNKILSTNWARGGQHPAPRYNKMLMKCPSYIYLAAQDNYYLEISKDTYDTELGPIYY